MRHILSLLFVTLFLTTGYAVDKTINSDIVAKLKIAATALDRSALLLENSDWIFDFRAQPSYTYSPGSVVNANAATFPAVIGNGMTISMLNLGPCAMLSPHYHPRASNFVTSLEGNTTTWMILENGARVVQTTLTPGKMTIFPPASLHTMQNNGW
jgi:mannose-6-phosphate isomerase-like protein (cupin superfamily)